MHTILYYILYGVPSTSYTLVRVRARVRGVYVYQQKKRSAEGTRCATSYSTFLPAAQENYLVDAARDITLATAYQQHSRS